MRIVAILVAFLFLTGCSLDGDRNNDSQTDQNSVSDSDRNNESTPDRNNVSESEYADFMREQLPSLRSVSDSTLAESAYVICEGLDSGMTFEELVGESVGSGLTPEQAGGLVGGAVAWHCPEHEDIFD